MTDPAEHYDEVERLCFAVDKALIPVLTGAFHIAGSSMDSLIPTASLFLFFGLLYEQNPEWYHAWLGKVLLGEPVPHDLLVVIPEMAPIEVRHEPE